MPIQVAIIEDDEEIRANLTHRIGGNSAFLLLRSYGDAESALADLPRHKPDVVLMDINLPGIDPVPVNLKPSWFRHLPCKLPGSRLGSHRRSFASAILTHSGISSTYEMLPMPTRWS